MHMLRWLEEVLWPHGLACICCGVLSEGELLCPSCRKALRAMRLGPEDAGEENIRSVYRYDGTAKQLVLLLKEQCLEDAAEVLAAEMAAMLNTMALPQDMILTWVTMPERRRKGRGIDHGRVLCEAVAEKTGRPVRQLLSREGKIHTQRGLDRVARLQNLANTIRCNMHIEAPVLVIDDVLTTGATVSACAEALRAAGAPQVYALTATRAVLKKNDDRRKD